MKKPAQGLVFAGRAGGFVFGGVLSILRNTSSGFCVGVAGFDFTGVDVAGIIRWLSTDIARTQ
jgi:hypothetical protein